MMQKSKHGKPTTLNEVEGSNETGNEGRTRAGGLADRAWILAALQRMASSRGEVKTGGKL